MLVIKTSWYKDILYKGKYSLQSMLVNVFNKIFFSWQHFETSPDLSFKTIHNQDIEKKLDSCIETKVNFQTKYENFFQVV